MSKTVLCVLLKVLMLARADNLSKYSDSDFIPNNNFKSDQSYPDSGSMKNKVDEISFPNMSASSESIESILSKPTSPRAFVEFHNGFLNEEDDISVTFRWNTPEFREEVIQGYTVKCCFKENQKEIQICDDKSISATILECTVQNLKPNTTYFFQVRAHTKIDASPYTDSINVSTAHENPIPKLLMITSNGIDMWDLDLKINVNLIQAENVKCVTYSIAEHKIYWSNRKRELMMFEMNKNNITKIATLLNFVYALCIDWVARNLYWLETEDPSMEPYIMKFDLTMWENGIIKYNKIFETSCALYPGNLNILPSIGILYCEKTSYNEDENFTRDFESYVIHLDGNNVQLDQNNISIICHFSFMSYDTVMKIDDMNSKKPLIYWLSPYFFFVTDINGSACNLILKNENVGHQIFFQSLEFDKTNIYIFTRKEMYILKKEYALLDSVDAFKYIQNMSISAAERHNIYAFGKSMQSYPLTKCLTPDKKDYNLEEVTITTNSIIVNLPEPVPKSGCKKYNLPTTLYTINIVSHCLNNEIDKFDNFTMQTYERYYEIQNLISLTEYKLLLTLSNFYFDQLAMNPLFGSEVTLRTKPSKLDAPKNVTVQVLTPTKVAVYWMPPKQLNCAPMIYRIYWKFIINTQEITQFLLVNKTEHKLDSKFLQQIIEPLIPGQKYWVYVRINPANFSDFYTDSLTKIVYVYSEPNNITLNEISINGMNISWIPTVNLTIYYVMEYRNVETQKWQIANNFEPNNEGKVMYYIKNLLPGTLYEFRLILRYPNYEKDFIWPSDGRFIFPTLTSGITVMQYYLSFIVSFVATVTIICVYYFYYLYRQRKKGSEQVLSSIMTDIELEILHEIPNGIIPNLQFSTLYSPMLQYNSDEYGLIKIKREEIRLEKLLGSGAFGMVFQGRVKNLERPGTEIPAAIKTLRKNASSQEKKKFLQEARLMNHFRHKHVLRLLAICLDQDSPLIVLELMEVGDLLQYLKDSRKLQPLDSHALRLYDLLAMCEDVARGCCYLENLRFVHRDLACRNCLVSARDRENRVIKIGDFGLARDIYKDDYYRVKGQGLLPVCWMAPESLVIGIFSSQSDVWSFAVLMWEITSLGEHPYTGKTNEEVIDYVRAGGRLPIPLNCPPTLYELMLRCWSPADDRPNFKVCLENIIALRNNIEDTLLSTVDII